MVNLLEEIGALKWRNEYQICNDNNAAIGSCLVEMDDSSCVELEGETLRCVLEKGMESCGFSEGKKVRSVCRIC